MNKQYLNVITHFHTYASNGPASSLDRVVRSILTDIFVEIPQGLVWRECFTSVDGLRQILAGRKTKKPVDILFVTDHVSSRHHKLDKNLVELATQERRIGLGCEIQTVKFSEKEGRFLISPEVLLYGDGTDREFKGALYTGIDDTMLAQLYTECTVCGSGEPEISKVNEFCRKNGIAYALAHPFDCQQLDLEDTLDLIHTFPYVETVNGGFPHRSSRALQEYVAFHNDIIENDLASALLESELTVEQRDRVEKISRSEILVPLGGSDAHLNNFDRVVTRFCTEHGKTLAKDFVKMMLDCPESEIIRLKKIEPVGRGCTVVGLYKDVIGIIYQNIRVYWSHFCKPHIWPRLVRTLTTTGLRELKVRINRNKSIASDYKTQLNVKGMRKTIVRIKNDKSYAQPHGCTQ